MTGQRLPQSARSHLRGVTAARTRLQNQNSRFGLPAVLVCAGDISTDQEAFVDALYAAAQPEHAYSRDADQPHAYALGTSVSLYFGGQTHRATVVSRFEFLGRLRYRLAFEHGQFALTEAQVKHLAVSPCTAITLYAPAGTALMAVA